MTVRQRYKSAVMGFIIGVILLLTRFPFYQAHFFNWDATQLGLSLFDFDIAHHQPHPPGYIFYVGMGRFLHLFGFSPEMTFQFLATIMTGIGLWGLYALARRFCGRTCAWIATLAALFHPYIWAYGVVGESYGAEFAFSTWIGVLAVDAWQGNARAALIGAALLGLGGGIRTSVSIFMGPLFLVALLRGHLTWKTRYGAVFLAAAGTLAWLVPSAYNVGGLTRYMELTRNLTMHVIAGMASPVFGVAPKFAHHEAILLFAWMGIILWPLAIPSFFSIILGTRSSLSTERKQHRSTGILPVALLWIVPAFTFHILLFASKPGYLLAYFAPLVVWESIACARLIAWVRQKWGERPAREITVAVIALAMGLGIQAFLTPPRFMKKSISISARTISSSETLLGLGLLAAKHEIANHPKGSVAFVVDSAMPDWRRFMYYTNHSPVYHLIYRFNYPFVGDGVDACAACSRRFSCASGPGFWTNLNLPKHLDLPLPGDINRIIIMSGLMEQGNLNGLAKDRSVSIEHQGPLKYLAVNMGKTPALNLGRIRFVRGTKAAWTKGIFSKCPTIQ